jgi:hypothetical protein
MGYFPEFYGISSDSPRHYSSLLISLILRPGNSMGLYGIFPGVLWENFASSWPSRRSLWEFYGIVWVILWEFYETIVP